MMTEDPGFISLIPTLVVFVLAVLTRRPIESLINQALRVGQFSMQILGQFWVQINTQTIVRNNVSLLSLKLEPRY